MVNKVYSIGGEETTNLLSSDSLVVYSDISLNSKFNAKATTSMQYTMPNEDDYLFYIETEDNTPDNLNNCIVASINSDNIYKTTDDISAVVVLSSPDYLYDYKDFIINATMSKYNVDKNVNVNAIKCSLNNIFMWIKGERILNPEFGNNLYQYLYSGINSYNTEQIMAELRNMVTTYEPRVSIQQVVNISDTLDHENNTIRLKIIYTIPSLNTQQYQYLYTYEKTSY